MEEKNKIRNAALYWQTCHKEGFPKGQKDVFYEWLEKDTQHSITYERLNTISQEITEHKKEIKMKNKTKIFPIISILLIITLVSILIFKLQY